MKRPGLVSSLCLPLVLLAMPVLAQPQGPAQAPPRGSGRAAPHPRELSRLQMTIMEDAFQRAVEAAHGHAVETAQLAAGMPPLFAMEGNTRVRGFRLDGYGVFFDVDLPPIPRTIEWQLRVFDPSAILTTDLEQLERQVQRINDTRVSQALTPLIKSMQRKVAAVNASAGSPAEGEDASARPTLVDERRSVPQSPFAGYITDIKATLTQIMLQYGTNIQLGAGDWLHVAAREMSPKLLPGNPTEATITLRIKGADLAALKAGSLTADEAARRVEITEVY